MIKYGEINTNINNITPVTFLIKYVTHEHTMYTMNLPGKEASHDLGHWPLLTQIEERNCKLRKMIKK